MPPQNTWRLSQAEDEKKHTAILSGLKYIRPDWGLIVSTKHSMGGKQ
jgi:hypothetical protein